MSCTLPDYSAAIEADRRRLEEEDHRLQDLFDGIAANVSERWGRKNPANADAVADMAIELSYKMRVALWHRRRDVDEYDLLYLGIPQRPGRQ